MIYYLRYIAKTLVFVCLMAGMGACKLNFTEGRKATVEIPTAIVHTAAEDSLLKTAAEEEFKPENFKYDTYFTDKQLVSFIKLALEQNYELQVVGLQRQMALELVYQNKARLLPDATGVVGVGATRYSEFTQEGVGNFDTNFSPNIRESQKMSNPLPDLRFGFASVWEVDIWQRQKSLIKGSAKRYEAMINFERFAKTQLVANVAMAYYDYQTNEYKLNVLNRNIALQERGFEIVKVQRAVGTVTELAVNQFEAQLLSIKAERWRIEQQLLEARNRLATYTGNYSITIEPVTGFINQELPISNTTASLNELIMQRPDIAEFSNRVDATNFELYAAKAAFIPSLTINAGLGFQSFNPQYFITPSALGFTIFSGLTAPIFTRRYLRTELRRSEYQNLQAFYELQQRSILAYQEIGNALEGLKNFTRALDVRRLQVEKLNEAIRNSNELFSAGFANYLEVITAQKATVQAELDLGLVKQSQYIYYIDVYRALGGYQE